jgi:hypothetical protein
MNLFEQKQNWKADVQHEMELEGTIVERESRDAHKGATVKDKCNCD